MSRRSNYRLRLKAQSDAAKATSLAHIVEMRRIEEQQQLTEALTESGRNIQMQQTLLAYLLAGTTSSPLVKGATQP